MMLIEGIGSTPPQARSEHLAAMQKAAKGLEATFLAEMLKPMGAAEARESFGGGIGEQQFTTFLLEEEAKAMVSSGGIGLAEEIFKSMTQSETPDVER